MQHCCNWKNTRKQPLNVCLWKKGQIAPFPTTVCRRQLENRTIQILILPTKKLQKLLLFCCCTTRDFDRSSVSNMQPEVFQRHSGSDECENEKQVVLLWKLSPLGLDTRDLLTFCSHSGILSFLHHSNRAEWPSSLLLFFFSSLICLEFLKKKKEKKENLGEFLDSSEQNHCRIRRRGKKELKEAENPGDSPKWEIEWSLFYVLYFSLCIIKS